MLCMLRVDATSEIVDRLCSQLTYGDQCKILAYLSPADRWHGDYNATGVACTAQQGCSKPDKCPCIHSAESNNMICVSCAEEIGGSLGFLDAGFRTQRASMPCVHSTYRLQRASQLPGFYFFFLGK